MQSLPLGGQLGCDTAHIGQKAHVQHPVGLIQHIDLHLFQRDEPLAHQVQQPPRRGDQHVYPGFQLVGLGVLGHTAKDHTAPEGQLFAIGAEILVDLQRQFPGGRQDQRPQVVLVIPLLPLFLQDRQGKRRRLAGAGLGAAQQIPARHHRRDRLFLNGRRRLVAHFFYGLEDLGAQSKFFKFHSISNFLMFQPLSRPLSMG